VLETNPVDSSPVTAEAAPAALDLGALYEEHRELLLHIACRKFRVPEQDAESLMQEVFVAYIEAGSTIENTRGWLVGAMCNASRYYWRVQAKSEPLPEDIGQQSDPQTTGLADQFATTLTLQKAMRYLQPRCRETLYLHYFEGRSASDVARQLDTTNRYAEKLIHNCLKRVREIYFSLTAVRR
jgi:RNA polymerase sigma factor (sigma-70 family)